MAKRLFFSFAATHNQHGQQQIIKAIQMVTLRARYFSEKGIKKQTKGVKI